MLRKSTKSEQEQRVLAAIEKFHEVLKTPECLDSDTFFNFLNKIDLPQSIVFTEDVQKFHQHIINYNWPWELIEKFADVLLELSLKRPDLISKERSVSVSEYVLGKSSVFSFELNSKINRLKAQ